MKESPEFDPQELEQLDALAEELRQAWPHPSLSDGFVERCTAARTPVWSFSEALRRNGLIRAAAGLLLLTLGAAPVVAWVGLWPGGEEEPRTILSQEPFEAVQVDPPGSELGDAADQVASPPFDEFDIEPWGQARRRALEEQNRLASAAHQWRSAAPSDLPVAADSEAGQLWSAFVELCRQGSGLPLEAALRERVAAYLLQDFHQCASGEEQAAWAAWHWLTSGESSRSDDPQRWWPTAPFWR